MKPILDKVAINFKNIGKSEDFFQNKKLIADTGKTFKRENFNYNKEKDVVFCPNGCELTLSKQIRKIKKITYKKYFGKKSFSSTCPDREFLNTKIGFSYRFIRRLFLNYFLSLIISLTLSFQLPVWIILSKSVPNLPDNNSILLFLLNSSQFLYIIYNAFP